MKRYFSLLYKSYPLPEERGAQIKMAGAVSLAVFLFLFIVRPFYMGSTAGEALLNCVLSAVVVFGVVMVHFLVLFPLFPRFFREDRWTVGREMIWTLLIILSIALANIGFNVLTGPFVLTVRKFFLIIAYTAMVGMAPASVSIVLNQMRLLRRYKKAAADLSEHLHHPVGRDAEALEGGSGGAGEQITDQPFRRNKKEAEQSSNEEASEETVPDHFKGIAPADPFIDPPEAYDPALSGTIKVPKSPGIAMVTHGSITLVADNGKDEMTISPADLLAVTSADNYCKIFVRLGQGVQTTILRISLKKVEAALAGDGRFWRCHRTAIVNLPVVDNVSGTAQGYRLHIPQLTDTIPVSRSLNGELKKRL